MLGRLALAWSLFVPGGIQPAHASGPPAIQITPNSGRYGTSTVVTGQGFAAHEQVVIYRGTRPFFAHETDSHAISSERPTR